MSPIEEDEDDYEIDEEYEFVEEKETDDEEHNIEFALQRLTRLSSNKVPSNYKEYGDKYFDKYSINSKRVVLKIPLEVFHERLIHHFDIRFKKMILNGHKEQNLIKSQRIYKVNH